LPYQIQSNISPFNLPHPGGAGGEEVTILAISVVVVLLATVFYAIVSWEPAKMGFFQNNKQAAIVFSIALAISAVYFAPITEIIVGLIGISTVLMVILFVIVLALFVYTSIWKQVGGTADALGDVTKQIDKYRDGKLESQQKKAERDTKLASSIKKEEREKFKQTGELPDKIEDQYTDAENKVQKITMPTAPAPVIDYLEKVGDLLEQVPTKSPDDPGYMKSNAGSRLMKAIADQSRELRRAYDTTGGVLEVGNVDDEIERLETLLEKVNLGKNKKAKFKDGKKKIKGDMGAVNTLVRNLLTKADERFHHMGSNTDMSEDDARAIMEEIRKDSTLIEENLKKVQVSLQELSDLEGDFGGKIMDRKNDLIKKIRDKIKDINKNKVKNPTYRSNTNKDAIPFKYEKKKPRSIIINHKHRMDFGGGTAMINGVGWLFQAQTNSVEQLQAVFDALKAVSSEAGIPAAFAALNTNKAGTA